MFQTHVHRVRGIAILFIVGLHCAAFLSWNNYPVANKLLRTFFENSTVIFVFIMGYLFQHLSSRFNYASYLKNKVKNVITPYILLSIPAIGYEIVHGGISGRIEALHNTSVAYQIGWLYLYPGAHLNYALWFIPVVALYYICAPLLLAIDKRNYYPVVLPILLAISLFGHRPTYAHGHNLQLSLYLLSCYILGMYFSRNKATLEPLTAQYSWLIFLAFVATFSLYAFDGKNFEGYEVQQLFSFEHGYIDLIYLQKIILTIFLLGFMQSFNSMKLTAIDYLADISFSIFFVHLYALFAIHAILRWKTPDGSAMRFIGLYFLVMAISCGFAAAGRTIFGRYSRSLIGS